jgi:hypothetical protein
MGPIGYKLFQEYFDFSFFFLQTFPCPRKKINDKNDEASPREREGERGRDRETEREIGRERAREGEREGERAKERGRGREH